MDWPDSDFDTGPTVGWVQWKMTLHQHWCTLFVQVVRKDDDLCEVQISPPMRSLFEPDTQEMQDLAQVACSDTIHSDNHETPLRYTFEDTALLHPSTDDWSPKDETPLRFVVDDNTLLHISASGRTVMNTEICEITLQCTDVPQESEESSANRTVHTGPVDYAAELERYLPDRMPRWRDELKELLTSPGLERNAIVKGDLVLGPYERAVWDEVVRERQWSFSSS